MSERLRNPFPGPEQQEPIDPLDQDIKAFLDRIPETKDYREGLSKILPRIYGERIKGRVHAETRQMVDGRTFTPLPTWPIIKVAEKHPRLFPLILDRYFSPSSNSDTIHRESVKANERYRAEQMQRLLDDVYGEENIKRALKPLTSEERTMLLSEKNTEFQTEILRRILNLSGAAGDEIDVVPFGKVLYGSEKKPRTER